MFIKNNLNQCSLIISAGNIIFWKKWWYTFLIVRKQQHCCSYQSQQNLKSSKIALLSSINLQHVKQMEQKISKILHYYFSLFCRLASVKSYLNENEAKNVQNGDVDLPQIPDFVMRYVENHLAHWGQWWFIFFCIFSHSYFLWPDFSFKECLFNFQPLQENGVVIFYSNEWHTISSTWTLFVLQKGYGEPIFHSLSSFTELWIESNRKLVQSSVYWPYWWKSYYSQRILSTIWLTATRLCRVYGRLILQMQGLSFLGKLDFRFLPKNGW